jgi:hypothetical protein
MPVELGVSVYPQPQELSIGKKKTPRLYPHPSVQPNNDADRRDPRRVGPRRQLVRNVRVGLSPGCRLFSWHGTRHPAPFRRPHGSAKPNTPGPLFGLVLPSLVPPPSSSSPPPHPPRGHFLGPHKYTLRSAPLHYTALPLPPRSGRSRTYPAHASPPIDPARRHVVGGHVPRLLPRARLRVPGEAQAGEGHRPAAPPRQQVAGAPLAAVDAPHAAGRSRRGARGGREEGREGRRRRVRQAAAPRATRRRSGQG